ncbi:MAG: hypothetical protein EG826_04595 [Deltaproteobacteria bacterium]|nr:hypothetical protein [Deltaproteobacteria bacterium]
MLIRVKNIIYLMTFVLILAGCATKSMISTTADRTDGPAKSDGLFNQKHSDQELFIEAMSYLSNEQKEPNYNEAKLKVENLINQYPRSKWIGASRALLTSLDRISALQNQLKQERQKNQGENTKLSKEIELLRDNNKQLEDRLSAEIVRLREENEQLKRDIQQLKNLEIQLEKREKMLR